MIIRKMGIMNGIRLCIRLSGVVNGVRLKRMIATDALDKFQLPHTFQVSNKSFVMTECPPGSLGVHWTDTERTLGCWIGTEQCLSRADLMKSSSCEESASSADGVGFDEFPNRESILHKIKTSQMVLISEEKESKELAVVYLLYPSPMVRSENPIYHAGYQIITKNYRKIGLGSMIWKLGGACSMSYFGYRGILGRTGTMTKGLAGLMNLSFIFLGIVPRSVWVANKGMTDDLVVFSQYTDNEQEPQIANPLPALEESNLTPYNEVSFAPVTMSLPAGTFTLRPSASRDVELVEQLIREAAESGSGFAIDEFKPNGQFNRAFFQRCHLAVLCDSNESFIGAALFGLSSLVRTTTLQTSHIYIVIDKAYRNKGIGQTMLKEMLKVIRSVGYERIITDIYSYNHTALHICHKLKFILTASMPNCGHLKSKGYCSSYIFVDRSNNIICESTVPLELLAKLLNLE